MQAPRYISHRFVVCVRSPTARSWWAKRIASGEPMEVKWPCILPSLLFSYMVDNTNVLLGFRRHKAKLHQDTLSTVSLLQESRIKKGQEAAIHGIGEDLLRHTQMCWHGRRQLKDTLTTASSAIRSLRFRAEGASLHNMSTEVFHHHLFYLMPEIGEANHQAKLSGFAF